jgi:predicted deacylase
MELGTATAAPGEVARGYLDVTDLPTGTAERLPVVVAEGEADGPELWVTAGIHGDEQTGIAAAQDVVTASLPGRLSGTLVCLPLLNPAGLRRTTRTSYYHDEDPNRYFPDPDVEHARPPNVQERIDERLYEAFADSADALVDLHTATVGSVPFVIRDRVLYGERRDESAAEDLAEDLATLVEAGPLPVVNEYAAAEYTDQNLQRSTAGAALNNAGIPSFTVELGSPNVVEEDNRALGVRTVYDVMVELGMVESVPEGVDAAEEPYEAPVDFPVKRHRGPHTDTSGIVRHHVEAGDVVEADEAVADVVTPHGDRRTELTTDHDGYVLGRWRGIGAYEGDAVASMAVRDDGDLVVPRDGED